MIFKNEINAKKSKISRLVSKYSETENAVEEFPLYKIRRLRVFLLNS